VAAATRGGPIGSPVIGGGCSCWISTSGHGRSGVIGSPLLLISPPPPAVEPCPPGGHQVDLVALSGGATPDSWHQGGVCWVRFSGWGARPFCVTVLSTPWWGGRRVPRMSDGHPLPGVELRVMSPASMEEGGKALSKALATESHGTLWLWWSA
jgi:hypothetical protein